MADTSIPSGSNSVNTQYNYSTTKSTATNSSLNMQDFLTLVVAQMQNQDISGGSGGGGSSNTDFLAQMAQISSMQAMQELSSAFMSSMSMSYIGKYAKASAYTTDEKGEQFKPVQAEGYVERVNFNGGEAMVLIGTTWFNVSDVYEVSTLSPADAEAKAAANTANKTDTATEAG